MRGVAVFIALILYSGDAFSQSGLPGACPATIMINKSSEAWNNRDRSEMEAFRPRCKELYAEAPCLKRFIKRAPLTYWALCGEL